MNTEAIIKRLNETCGDEFELPSRIRMLAAEAADALGALEAKAAAAEYNSNVLRDTLDAVIPERGALRAKLAELEAQASKPVAWVDVVDQHQGPYHFHGLEFLDSGKHHLFTRSVPATSVPDGWIMVPVEPTEAMMRAAVVSANGNAVYKNVTAEALRIEEQIYGEAYSAMLAAAPAAPASAQDDVARDTVAEAIRRAFTKLPRYSFIHSAGSVRSVLDSCGSWVDCTSVHELFDPVAVDAAMAAAPKGGA